MSFCDLLIIIILVLFLTKGINSFGHSNNLGLKEIKLLQWVFIYHEIVSLFFSYYFAKNGGDALPYWFISNRFTLIVPWESYFRTGTSFILFLTYPLVKYLNISFYIGGLLWGMIGFTSFIYLYVIIRKFVKKQIFVFGMPIFPYILLLPNLHFWSSGIGKDALTLFAITLFFYSLFNIKKHWLSIIFALVLSYFIRPHIALFLMVSAVSAVIADGRMKISTKIALSILMIVGAVIMLEKVMLYLQLEEISTDAINNFSESTRGKLSEGAGSAVDTSTYPLLLKVFTFLYRPFFFDINGFMSVIVSFENLVLLIFTFLAIRFKSFNALLKAPMPIKAMFIFFIISSFAFSIMLSNLGIMIRQKLPVIFCLFVVVFWCIAYINSHKRLNELSN